MKTFLLILVLFNDGGSIEQVVDSGLSWEDCQAYEQGNYNLYCQEESK